jgi:hypothetical protein
MSMSLDGYIAGPNDKPGNAGGDNFIRLHEWYGFASDAAPTAETVDASGIGSQFLDEIRRTGAVLSGRNTVEQVDHWSGDHHDGVVPIFVPSHRAPGPSVAKYPLVTYVEDGIASAMAQAKGGRRSAVGGRRSAVGGRRSAVEAGCSSPAIGVAPMANSGDFYHSGNFVNQVQHSVVTSPGGPGWIERRVQRLADSVRITKQRSGDELIGGCGHLRRQHLGE